MGDPAGIGPEISLKAIEDPEVRACCQPVIVGDAQTLARTARSLSLPFTYEVARRGAEWPPHDEAPLVYSLDNIAGPVALGVESEIAGRASAEYIEAAVELCAAGVAAAITTAPINKKAIFLGGYSFPGHTEFLAHLTGTEDFAMAFVAANLRIVLLSTHVPLAQAVRLVEKERLVHVIKLAHRELQRWGLQRPRLAVAALNPHGAEGGLFGVEEAAEILPAVQECQAAGLTEVSGPYSADTIFLRAAHGEFDAVISCYHDQAMIPVKCLSFGEAVNVTLGLPFIRTSVDHGTAFDIAGKGIAGHSSLVAAIKLAAELSSRAEESGRLATL
jgi:4-hydroxythreonine-4-phosphate dehydrogenase